MCHYEQPSPLHHPPHLAILRLAWPSLPYILRNNVAMSFKFIPTDWHCELTKNYGFFGGVEDLQSSVRVECSISNTTPDPESSLVKVSESGHFTVINLIKQCD